MRQLLNYFGLSLVLVLAGVGVVYLLGAGPEVTKAVWASAAIALTTQLVSYAVARQFIAENPTAAWGIGSLIRFAVLLMYAFGGVGALGLESGPALFSLAGFLFVTMVIEPLFLKNSK